ncbi:MAG: 4-hydroxy-3-methylbut-2-enyl diphosphate reductase, partial [Acidimicrobiales bacterium]
APGTLVVADRILDAGGRPVGPPLASAALVASALARAGLPVRTGAVVCADRVVLGGSARRRLARTGALAVDLESAALVRPAWDRPVAVVRAVADTPSRGLASPGIVPAGVAALRALRTATPVLASWAALTGSRRVLLAGPRSFCAGVERAIHTVEAALDRWGAPVYVRRQIVHNRHVVEDLEARGAVFVRELDEVPDGATVVFSAHGVAPAVRQAAASRPLRVVDATCPLVAKVHAEVRRFADRGYQVVMIGHPGHDETEATLGEAADIRLVSTPDDAAEVAVDDQDRVAYITQTTLSPEDVSGVVTALRSRFPTLVGPRASDICYATQNRQAAVAAIAGDCDLVLVVGSPNSSNTQRLAEVARRFGPRAELVDDATGIDPAWLADVQTVGVTAGASAPEAIVRRVVDALAGAGPVSVEERSLMSEHVSFSLPLEVR